MSLGFNYSSQGNFRAGHSPFIISFDQAYAARIHAEDD
jgi:hypothetical protein